MVGLFTVFYGHVHGTELPAGANTVTYAIGFALTTGLLHLSGTPSVWWYAGRGARWLCGWALRSSRSSASGFSSTSSKRETKPDWTWAAATGGAASRCAAGGCAGAYDAQGHE